MMAHINIDKCLCPVCHSYRVGIVLYCSGPLSELSQEHHKVLAECSFQVGLLAHSYNILCMYARGLCAAGWPTIAYVYVIRHQVLSVVHAASQQCRP